jgi:hypothetical protein
MISARRYRIPQSICHFKAAGREILPEETSTEAMLLSKRSYEPAIVLLEGFGGRIAPSGRNDNWE